MEKDKDKNETENKVGIGYDGRRYLHMRAMVADRSGKLKMRMVTEEHESVTNEPSGCYPSHFTPDTPVHSEKPALKVAQGLFNILVQHNSTDSIEFLAGDSSNIKLGGREATMHSLGRCWRGGSSGASALFILMSCPSITSLLTLMDRHALTRRSLNLCVPSSAR